MDNPSSVIEFFFFCCCCSRCAFVDAYEMKEESVFLCSHASSLLRVFWPPNVSTGKPLSKRRHSGVTNSKTCVYLHFAACYHDVQLLHCAKLVVIVVVDHLHGLASALVFCLLSPLTPSSSPSPSSPPRQRSFFGKQFEHQRGGAPHSRHNAGTKRY